MQAALSDLIGQELGLSGLRKAAGRITEIYREQGYFLARAYLPAQDIADGVVRIAVLEGRFGAVDSGGSPRLEQEHAQGISRRIRLPRASRSSVPPSSAA